jgi:hypothetical protein
VLGLLTFKQVESLKDQSDEYIALSARSICAGFIANITEDAKVRTRIIAEHWKSIAHFNAKAGWWARFALSTPRLHFMVSPLGVDPFFRGYAIV